MFSRAVTRPALATALGARSALVPVAGFHASAAPQASLRELEARLKSVKNIKKITKSMMMIASTRLGRAQRAMNAAVTFGNASEEVYKQSEVQAPEGGKQLLIVVSSDKGLCGGIHSSVSKRTRLEVAQVTKAGGEAPSVVVLGEKAKAQLGRAMPQNLVLSFNQIGKGIPTYDDALAITDTILKSGVEFDKINIIYNKYVSSISFESTIVPVYSEKALLEAPKFGAYEMEEGTAKDLAEFSFTNAVFTALVEGHASEINSKRNAMDNASKNAGDMITNLNLLYNRGRQATITNELIDIITATSTFHFSKQEEEVIAYWNAIDAFKTSLEQSKGRKPFSFYDGPPFATGLPHYGHLLAGTVKDIVTRFAHSTGHYVDRRFGWDCHGLPVEHEIDKKLGVKGKEDILAMGIPKYNEECRAIVMRYQAEWRTTVERMGRWIDFDNGYKTMDTKFMETEWWVFKNLYEKGQVYRGLRVMPYSNACTTPLSNFEAGSNYKEVQDPACTVAFTLCEDNTTAFLAWTTTPWTLPSNLALCVHPALEYVKIFDEERQRHFILSPSLLTTVYKDPKKAKIKTLEKYIGKDLVGKEYVPLFPYFYDEYKDRAFRVLSDEYVTADAGTGIVHQAPAFGEDDYRVCLAHGLFTKEAQPPCPLDESGRFVAPVSDFEGMYVKDADKLIMKDLKARDLLVVQAVIRHQYPFCWRSGTPLIYRTIPSWFVRVEPIAEKLLEANKKTRWVPQTIGDHRFGNWLANARDWNVSRNRYWGTPIPLWVSDDMEEILCIGSVAELEERSGVTGITDLHRDKIDHITIPSSQGKGVLRRIEEVFDCWFESGSMPYAQAHYPFENTDKFETSFPADFISEGLDQTRGWFYTLLILGVHLFGMAPWKNLIVSGLVLAADGKKMSKSLRNFPDPSLVINKYGADAVRLYMINSPIVRAENLRFREEGVKDIIASVFLPWLNSFRFFLAQVVLLKKDTGIDYKYDANAKVSENVMDHWILARCQSLIEFVRVEMENYRLYTVVPRLLTMINELTNWYIRFNRRRLKGENGPEDTLAALHSLFETLYTVCLTMSSFTPFISENLYQGLRKFMSEDDSSVDYRSVHFLPFPSVKEAYLDPVIQRRFSALQNVIELGRTMREKNNLPLRVPLRELTVFHSDPQYLEDVRSLASYIEEELNIRDLVLTSDEKKCGVGFKLLADWPVLGRKLRKDMGKVKKGLDLVSSDEAKAYMSTGQITIEGILLGEGDLRAMRYVDATALGPNILSDSDGSVVVLLDGMVYPELQAEGMARDVINRIQRLRKKAGLQPTDEIDAFYRFTDDMSNALDEVMRTQTDVFVRNIRRAPRPASEQPADGDVVCEEEQEVNDIKFLLTLVRA